MTKQPQQIFILVCRDRHTDLGLSVHLTREGADAAIERFKAIYDDIDPTDWKEEQWGQPRWCRYVHAHDEGPSAYIELGENPWLESKMTDLRNRLLTAAQAYDRACTAFWEAAEACDHCDHDDSALSCADHAKLAREMSDARRRLLDLAHETGNNANRIGGEDL